MLKLRNSHDHREIALGIPSPGHRQNHVPMKYLFFLFASILLHTVKAQDLPAEADSSSTNSMPVKEVYHLDPATEDLVGYSQAVKYGNTLYISGTVALGNMETQLRKVYEQLDKTLKAYNTDFGAVLKETIYTTDMEALVLHKDVRKEFYQPDDFPTSTWLEVNQLYLPEYLVEIELIAYVED